MKDPQIRLQNVIGIRNHQYFEGINWRDIADRKIKSPILLNQENSIIKDDSIVQLQGIIGTTFNP